MKKRLFMRWEILCGYTLLTYNNYMNLEFYKGKIPLDLLLNVNTINISQ